MAMYVYPKWESKKTFSCQKRSPPQRGNVEVTPIANAMAHK